MVTANKATTDVRLPAQAETYLAELSFYDSTHGNRGPRATSVKFTTAAAPSKKKKECIFDPFELKMKKSAKPGLAEKYQLAIVGDYPTTVRPFQTVKLTLDVVSEGPSTLMINVLAKSDFSWAGGKIVPVPPGANGLMTVLFDMEGDLVDKEEYSIDALLLKDAKDYKSAYVSDTVKKVFGVLTPVAPPLPDPFPPATLPAADMAKPQPGAPVAVEKELDPATGEVLN
ncbi:hypothetical protein Naga_100290g1 [Nannochloropsis gaditana]|uniref:Uncharacterized protein n=1 Tax=Nannochloropsis gaditana TaxID=72520 RepID=W7T6B0_9STRA|nr:hypothetical protein Naga_100290g1 [Nannochloropsis gaditana]